MESITSDAHTHVEPGPTTAAPSAAGNPLQIRWGRTLFACVGLLALVTAGISGALSIFSLGSSALAWTGLAVFAGVIVALRFLAVRDATARKNARETARAAAQDEIDDATVETPVPRETTLFDGAEGAEPAPVQKPLTADELRAAAMRVAAKGSADAKLAHTQTLAEGELETETWEPVEVPVPGYVTAARALSLEKPIVLPEVPKSAGTSIKADQAGVGTVSGSEGVAAVPDVALTEDEIAAKATKISAERGQYALNNLDDVLQRRRA